MSDRMMQSNRVKSRGSSPTMVWYPCMVMAYLSVTILVTFLPVQAAFTLFLPAKTHNPCFSSSLPVPSRPPFPICNAVKSDGSQTPDSEYSTTELNDDTPLPKEPKKKKKTLYEVLGCRPDATRMELKQSYVKLARQSHPDAIRSKNTTQPNDQVDFAEIAAAWKILSDSKQRLRYDRSLQAESFTDEFERFAERLGHQAAPAAQKLLEKGGSLLRRTTATTLASFAAAAQQVQKTQNRTNPANNTQSTVTNNNSTTLQEDTLGGLGNAFWSALQAGQRAGLEIDSLEIREKLQELTQRAQAETKQMERLQHDLTEAQYRRLRLSMATPDVGLTSQEAKHLLERLNTDDKISIMDRAMLRRTILGEIQFLEGLETDYSIKQQEWQSVQATAQNLQRQVSDAQAALSLAEQQERETRQAWEEAKQNLSASRWQLQNKTRVLDQVDQKQNKVKFEFDRISFSLTKSQETVRKALFLKHKRRQQDLGTTNADLEPAPGDIEKVKRRERELLEEMKQREDVIDRLLSKAKKLDERAGDLEKFHKDMESRHKNTTNEPKQPNNSSKTASSNQAEPKESVATSSEPT